MCLHFPGHRQARCLRFRKQFQQQCLHLGEKEVSALKGKSLSCQIAYMCQMFILHSTRKSSEGQLSYGV